MIIAVLNRSIAIFSKSLHSHHVSLQATQYDTSSINAECFVNTMQGTSPSEIVLRQSKYEKLYSKSKFIFAYC
jgi:hypothetical protein